MVNEPAGGEELRTRAGTRLTKEYEDRLAAEAEAGFEPDGLIRRRTGRPSLSGVPGHSHRLGVRVDDDTYESIRRVAERQHRRISDVVRDAINGYLEAS